MSLDIHAGNKIFVYTPWDKIQKDWRERFNCQATQYVEELITKFHCNVLMVCINPNDLWNGIQLDLRKFDSSSQDLEPMYVISATVGLPMDQLKKHIPCNEYPYQVHYYRIITSMACSMSQSAFGIYSDPSNGPDADEVIDSLCSWFGSGIFTGINVNREEQLDAVVGVSSSGLGFCFEFIQAMSDGGVACGLNRDEATLCAAQTLIGAGKMVLNSGLHPYQLRDMVCSDDGTTDDGIHAMDERNVSLAIKEAVEAAARRSSLGRDHKIFTSSLHPQK